MMSKRIRALREKDGMTQEELAVRLTVTAGEVREWEAGRLPETEHLVALAALFGVTTDYLLGLGRESIDLTGLSGEARAILRRLAGRFRGKDGPGR